MKMMMVEKILSNYDEDQKEYMYRKKKYTNGLEGRRRPNPSKLYSCLTKRVMKTTTLRQALKDKIYEEHSQTLRY